MSTCCCTLAGTRACENCPNGPMRVPWMGKYEPIPYVQYPHTRRIVEKFDENGKLIERIIEE